MKKKSKSYLIQFNVSEPLESLGKFFEQLTKLGFRKNPWITTIDLADDWKTTSAIWVNVDFDGDLIGTLKGWEHSVLDPEENIYSFWKLESENADSASTITDTN